VAASGIAFLRVVFPSLILIIFSKWLPSQIIFAYMVSTVFIYWVTSLVITKWLGSSYWHKPSFKAMGQYIKSIHLGIVTLAFYFFGLGLLIVVAELFKKDIVAIAYLGLKLYVVFKGVLRIVNQAFLKEMLNDVVGLRVDQIAGLAGFTFASCFAIFPNSFISLFFDQQYLQYKSFLLAIGISGFIASFGTSLSTRSMLQQKDKAYARISILAILVSICLIVVLSFLYQNPLSIGIALLSGELVTLLGLLWINKDINLKSRFVFLFKISPLLTIPFCARVFEGDTYKGLISGMLLFCAGAAYILYKQFSSYSSIKPSI
jgi:O-antigen/teichoic acid export membrane protein